MADLTSDEIRAVTRMTKAQLAHYRHKIEHVIYPSEKEMARYSSKDELVNAVLRHMTEQQVRS